MEKKWKIDHKNPFTKMRTSFLKMLLERGLTAADRECAQIYVDFWTAGGWRRTRKIADVDGVHIFIDGAGKKYVIDNNNPFTHMKIRVLRRLLAGGYMKQGALEYIRGLINFRDKQKKKAAAKELARVQVESFPDPRGN